MKKLSVFSLIFSLLFVFSCEDKSCDCEDEVKKDSIPPKVTLLNIESGSTVSNIITIKCISSDNEGVERVELWINGQSIGVSDKTEPYSMEWNTITYDDGSYVATVRSYDTSGNTTDSNPITLNVVRTITFGNEEYSLEKTSSIECNDCGHIGEIPSEIGYMTNLKYLKISHNNQITGNIPTVIGNLKNLIQLVINSNDQLTGEIPSEIGNLTKLESLTISGNKQMSGEIPSEIGNLTNLERLSLVLNQLTGEIPSEIGNLTNLDHLSLNVNQLTGSIPSSIGNMTNLYSLRLDDNQLTGSIPSNIGNMTTLRGLELDKNQLSGVIPESICDLNLLLGGTIRLSGNQLCPPYPTCLENLNLIGTQDTTNCG